ncbi:hypothetical protein [Dokdonella sp.]|uniref:hypothetical protein n=1 Tax=Dokdonella sp. TaxID=2291710 RepID=UPI001B1C2B54|nr:hypothetical protein [Dokdonella sp.]MBO9661325.1 hypothetical protein [Dokdonella sp.]
MSEANWPRPQWRDSGDQAFLLWFVFGDFGEDLRIDAERYRTRGTPAGIEVVRYVNRELAKWDGYPLSGTLGRLLWEENARLFEQAKHAGECVMLRGAIADPADLDGLRDLVGTITALTDRGGVAVIDPQTLSMFDAAEWRRRYFAADTLNARDHVLILCDEDSRNDGRLHVHTRGLRKFARPDISVRNVPSDATDLAGGMAERFVAFQVAGGVVEDGHTVEIDGAPDGMTVRIAGAEDDPEFNNRHLALRWPD